MDKAMRNILITLGILCVISITTAFRFLAKERETYRMYIETRKTLEAENARLNQGLAASEDERGKLRFQLERTERQLKKLQVDLAKLNEARSSLESELTNTKEELQATKEEKEDLALKISGMESALKEKKNQIERLSSRLKEREEKIKLATKEPAVELSPIVVKAEKLPKTEGRKPRTNILTGQIVIVNEKYNFVVINLGKGYGIELGMLFEVFRDKDRIGEVEVIEAQEKVAAAQIRESVGQIKPGDLVQRFIYNDL